MKIKIHHLATLSLTAAALLQGCATPNRPKLEPITAHELSLSASAHPDESPSIRVRIAKATIVNKAMFGNKQMDVQPEWIVAQELRAFTQNVADQFRTNDIFAVAGAASNPSAPDFTVLLSFDEREDTHVGEAATKGFLVGFFTLGLGGGLLQQKYDFESDVQFEIRRRDGISKTYSANSSAGSKTAQYAADARQAPQVARSQAREACLKEILAQMSVDRAFLTLNSQR